MVMRLSDDLGADFHDWRSHHLAGIFQGGDGLVVAAGDGVGADAGHIFEHLDAVLQVTHAAALVVTPGDRNLADDVLQLAGDEEDFRIEAPALDGLEAEDDLSGIALEGLEAALRVFVRQSHDSAGDPIETAAEELAGGGLME